MSRVCRWGVALASCWALFWLKPCVLADSSNAQDEQSGGVEFDSYMLKNRHIDPNLARYFANGAKFSAGNESIDLYVNGIPKGRAVGTFNERGELVFTAALLEAAQLKFPPDATTASNSDTGFMKVFPMTEVELNPGKREVRLIVPTDAIQDLEVNLGAYEQGGSAALLNYDLMAVNSEFNGSASTFRRLDTVAGFNAGGWLMRSRQSWNTQNGDEQVAHMYTYAQKNILSLKSTFQAGQINLDNSLYSGVGITGLQLVPESALRKLEQSTGAEVEGIANSTSRVEVRQSSALIYSTVVPAGPFRLTDLPLLNSSGDLDVRIVEADGASRSFTVPAASFSNGTRDAATGYSVAAGQYRDGSDATPNLITATGTWNVSRNTSSSVGGMLADGYESLGWASDYALLSDIHLGVRQLFSNAQALGKRGAMLSASLSAQISDEFSLSLSATQQSEGYFSLGETLSEQVYTPQHQGANEGQYTMSTSWSNPQLGAFRMSYSYSKPFDAQPTKRLTGSWATRIKAATVSLNLEKNLGEAEDDWSGDRAMLSISFPIGTSSVRTYVNHDKRGTRTGASANRTVSDTFSYWMQGERDSESGENDVSVSANFLPHYARATVGYSQGGGSESYNASLVGGIVAHSDGVTFTPNEVKDTFSILSVGDMSGVKITTPSGTVWTDAAGHAVASGLQPYQSNRMQITTKTLPRNVDIVNGYKELKVGRGSVSHVDFAVMKTRRLLMDATLSNGTPLDKGLSVFAAGQYLTTVVEHGQIFIPNIESGAHLTVELSDGQSCELDYEIPEQAEAGVYFESVPAVCRVVHGS